MAAVSLLGSTFNTTSGAKTVTASPAVGDLILIFVAVSGDSTHSAPTDNQSGTYTIIGSQLNNNSALYGAWYVRDALVPAGSSTIFTLSNPGSDTGGGLAVVKITGMSNAGSSAVRQSKLGGQGGSSAATPATGTWTSSKLTTNPVVGAVINLSNPANLTPTTSYSELLDTGYSTPASGVEIQKIDSGDTSNTMTWGGSSGSDWVCMGVELEATVSHQSTGSLSAQSATLSGSGVRVGYRPSTGALIAQAAVLDATGEHTGSFFSDGALVAQAASLSGAAVHSFLHSSTGALIAQAAVLNGAVQPTTRVTLVLTRLTGTFAAGGIKVGSTQVGTCESAQVVNGETDAQKHAQYKNLAADEYRGDISALPGSGSVLGVWVYNDTVYAFRNASDGLTAKMYKESASGWTEVALGRELSYTSGGTYVIKVGDTVTGETSGATAVLTGVTVESGSFAAGTAAGRLIFASDTGTFQSETLKVGANLNVCTITGDASAITFAVPGGRFEFGNYNFEGSTKMYGVDGKNRGFEFDGTTFIPIATGYATDTPSFLQEHLNHLFFAYGSSVQHSGIGTPHTWTIVSGAAELYMGDTVTGFKQQSGGNDSGALTIFTRNRIKILYGTDSSSWNLIPYKQETGAYPYTVQQLGNTLMLDDRGLTSLVAAQEYGNFADQSLSRHIQNWINNRRTLSRASCIVRDKSQYRLFFTDGYALYVTMNAGKVVGIMPIKLLDTPTCICSVELSTGEEAMFFGDSSGMVYQLDKGTSFDGDAIEFYLNMAYNHLGSPRVLKSFRNAVLEVAGTGYSEFYFGYDLGYGSTEIAQPRLNRASVNLASYQWDNSDTSFDAGASWDGRNLLPSNFDMGGDAENVSIRIQGNGDYFQPVKFSGVLIRYIGRRAIR